MKYAQVSILVSILLFGAVSPAAAEGPSLIPPATPAPREAVVAPGVPAPAFRTERNSLTLLFTGVGLAVAGLGGLGGGYAGTVAGRRDCDASALSTTRDLPIATAPGVYEVAYSRCLNDSGAVTGGTAAMIAGGAFTAIGTAFIVAGAWRVTVPVPSTSAMVPKVDIGTSSLQLRWAF